MLWLQNKASCNSWQGYHIGFFNAKFDKSGFFKTSVVPEFQFDVLAFLVFYSSFYFL